MPTAPFPARGACEQDREKTIVLLKEMGYEVEILMKVFDWQKLDIPSLEDKYGIKIYTEEFYYKKDKNIFKKVLRLFNPFLWDGASYEYRNKKTKQKLNKILDDFKPDVVLFEYSFLYPLYSEVRRRNIRVVTRSHNFEPLHYLDETGFSIFKPFIFLSKLLTEIITISKSDVILAISPRENKIYKKITRKPIYTLPIVALAFFENKERIHENKNKLDLFFMGSRYTIRHNLEALKFLVYQLAPELEKEGISFRLNITGAKVPDFIKSKENDKIVLHDYIDNLGSFIDTMDIAIVPASLGHGMQLKIFEPITYGLPVITNSRGVAGYDFKEGQEILFASNKNDFVRAIRLLNNAKLREQIGNRAKEKSKELFSKEKMQEIFSKIID